MIARVKFIVDFDVKVSPILAVWLVGEKALDRLSFFDSKNFSEVENSLLPMRVLCVRPGRESDWFVARCEVNIKPGNKSMDEVVSLHSKLELL